MKTKLSCVILLFLIGMIPTDRATGGPDTTRIGLLAGVASPIWGSPELTLSLDTVGRPSAPQFHLRAHGPPFVPYAIQASPDMSLWTALVTNVTGGDGRLDFTDPQGGGAGRRFYRALLARPPSGWGGISLAAGGFRPDRILVKPKAGKALAPVNILLGTVVLETFPGIGNLQVLQVPAGESAQQLIAAYQQSGSVAYAEPDFAVHLLQAPDDPRYADGTLWGFHNTGQLGGTPGADIDAAGGWDLQHGADNIIVAILDTGARYTHEDLAANMWTNPGGTNHGINTITGTGDPWDDFGHGTHVSGTIGAVGNNSLGVVGVAWGVQLLECKFIDAKGDGSISDAITCIDYARAHGAKIINASWGATNFTSSALHDAIASARDAGVIFVAAAGNSQDNNDGPNAIYPASYTDLDNVISVAATDRNDHLAGFSNFGAKSVHLAAPGESIFSTYNDNDSSYVSMSGTSMAAAFVSGACAVVWAHYPNENYKQIIQRVVTGTDPLPSLAGKTVSGGRLDLFKALSGSSSQSPPPPPPSSPPTANFTASPTSGDVPLTVQFTDQSTGTVTAWDWDFGDGTSHGALQNPSHTYGSAGSYTVTLTVSGAGTTSSQSATIQVAGSSPSSPSPPEAIFGAYPLSGQAPLPVQFFDESSGAVTAWDWDFGDGSPHGKVKNSSHTYTSAGTFTVTLTVTDNTGATGSMSGTVHVTAPPASPSPAPPPVASFTADPTSGDAPLTVQFTDQSSGTVSSWDWNFGDGSSDSSRQNPSHTYTDPGSYPVTLTVSGAGSTSSSSTVIQVNNPAPPPPVAGDPRPTVTVVATVPTASVLGAPGTFTIRLSSSTASPITVLYSMGGNAQNGADYQTLSGSVTITAGDTSAVVVVQPVVNPAMTLDQPVYLMLYGYTGAPYTVAIPDAAAITIEGNH